jgi:hypothetical protein
MIDFITVQWSLALVILQKMFLSFLPLYKLSLAARIIPSQHHLFNMEILSALASIVQRRKNDTNVSTSCDVIGLSYGEKTFHSVLIPLIIPQPFEPNVPLRLFEFIHHPLRPPNSQCPTKILHFLLAMESPELPAAFRPAERFNDLLTSRVLLQKARAVIYNVVNDDN